MEKIVNVLFPTSTKSEGWRFMSRNMREMALPSGWRMR